jgi:hypothetical protein
MVSPAMELFFALPDARTRERDLPRGLRQEPATVESFGTYSSHSPYRSTFPVTVAR